MVNTKCMKTLVVVHLLIQLLIQIAPLTTHAKEWCKVKFEFGKADYAECQSETENIAKYMIHTTPVISNDVDLYANVSLVMSNGYGFKTKEINIGSEEQGLLSKTFAVATDIGSPEYVHVKINSVKKNWKCKKITIWKNYKYWVFDCAASLNDKNPQGTYFLSGNKMYTAFVKTGNEVQAGTSGTVDIVLVGNNRRSNTKVLHEGFQSGVLKKIKFQASDVGKIEDIILTNNAKRDDPWYCDFVKIKSDNKLYIFNVKSWIGHPYEKTVKINIRADQSVDGGATKDIDCHIRGNDLINMNNLPHALQSKVQIFKVRCPQNCQNAEFASVEGSSIHPSSSSICTSAIHDGSLTPSGGSIIITVGSDLHQYHSVKEKINNIEAIDVLTKVDEPNFSFYTYRLESIDDVKSNVRIVDAFGKLSSLGRLEIRRSDNTWGTVCKKGPNFTFSDDSAKRACADLGFANGVYIKEMCFNLNGQNYCAGYKYPFSSAGMVCSGNEKSLLNCNADDSSHCVDHHDDVIIQCLNEQTNKESLSDGMIRLVDITGAPTTNGIGRLEMFYNGSFGSVCSEGWVKEGEKIACRELGYTGLKGNGFSHHLCANIAGENLCGHDADKINAVNIKCKGDEKSLQNCAHETHEDIYCSHDEDIVLGCSGGEGGEEEEFQGGSQENAQNNHHISTAPGLKKHFLTLEKKNFPRKIELTCFDKIVSIADLSAAQVGEVFLASCPEKCDEEIGIIKGTFLYTFDSPICKAAIHAGVLSSNVADDIVLIISHKHHNFVGTKRNNVESHEFAGTSKGFSISIPTRSIIQEERKSNHKYAEENSDKAFSDDDGLEDQHAEHSYSLLAPPHIQRQNGRLTTRVIGTQPTFQWIPPMGSPGFNGKENDFVNCINLPNEKYIKSMSNFTFIIYFTVSGGAGNWRTLLSHSLCDGISISVNEENELIIEQNCNPHLLKSKFKPVIGQTYHLAVAFNKTNKSVTLYVNGKKLPTEKVKYDFTLNGDLVIGRSNQSTTDYFIGSIHLVEVYKFVLADDEIKQLANAALSLDYLSGGSDSNYNDIRRTKRGKKTSGMNRKTVDGRECMTPCKPQSIINKELQINAEQINLSCKDDLLSHQFNSKIGSHFLVHCSDNCSKSNFIVKGSNNYYTPDSSICKAAIHAGVYRPKRKNGDENNSFILKIVNGLFEYKSARGHMGIVSKAERQSQLRSFSIFPENDDNILSCSSNGHLFLNLPVGEKRTIICPSGCDKMEGKIWGTNVYTPSSTLCKAAIHSGALSNQGGLVDMSIGSGVDKFTGATQNGIESHSSAQHSRSLIFSTHSQ
ncbi:multidomain scavenger receptor, putative [Plasmodium knowlesi strain H]|uniref:Multidomain scavenger receptor, putative n=3 Tax=Plasmodium knowlesi TaxID=5850 RepID=A0A5K1UAG1_PLAKH|nr:LCCL domain-containing protein, putative [Plasmodium knowlesi strain H]OTN67787.1 putative Multidomain scavenger receptor [Plasmodium knowlesi]CAA9990536.1 LCCL domain-containing protein, putative [Plasmodium knowlesi strain H]SBO19785.1 multidomain scavenger receptor, putative [Plasmodium knowlesi strain H]SBO22410.1 multidomain scavenger receptor, putative [Plasmodium knowlesi strain H]VVS80010.1 LCCL domain-containing protein, putative [Plasmodium knowlesi strain H]|eukprot:XP_002260922.1 multidomain scavenger receptor, putative [Plasmodium knowlesi strain H]